MRRQLLCVLTPKAEHNPHTGLSSIWAKVSRTLSGQVAWWGRSRQLLGPNTETSPHMWIKDRSPAFKQANKRCQAKSDPALLSWRRRIMFPRKPGSTGLWTSRRIWGSRVRARGKRVSQGSSSTPTWVSPWSILKAAAVSPTRMCSRMLALFKTSNMKSSQIESAVHTRTPDGATKICRRLETKPVAWSWQWPKHHLSTNRRKAPKRRLKRSRMRQF